MFWYVVVFLCIAFTIYNFTKEFIESWKEKTKDRAARDMSLEFNYEEEKNKIFNIAKPYTNNGNRCPKCDGILDVRYGKYGEFIGCRNYPNCNYTKSL